MLNFKQFVDGCMAQTLENTVNIAHLPADQFNRGTNPNSKNCSVLQLAYFSYEYWKKYLFFFFLGILSPNLEKTPAKHVDLDHSIALQT